MSELGRQCYVGVKVLKGSLIVRHTWGSTEGGSSVVLRVEGRNSRRSHNAWSVAGECACQLHMLSLSQCL